MLPRGLFSSRTFTLANVLTLFLYAALAETLFLMPMDLIQVQRLHARRLRARRSLPFPIIMFAAVALVGRSRRARRQSASADGRSARRRHRVSRCAARRRAIGSFATTFLPAIVVVGLGMAITVAPLTTTVMESVSERSLGRGERHQQRRARIAGLIAIAVFGVIVARTFNARLTPRLARLDLTPAARAGVDLERPKMAGADVSSIPSLPPERRADVRDAFDSSFAAAYRISLLGAGLLALCAGGVGAAIAGSSHPKDGARTV